VTAVRRCVQCKAAALFVVREWQHKALGLFTGVKTFELECQNCRARVVLHPWTEINVERVFAFVFMPALFPGLFFWLRARKKARAWTENPIVERSSIEGIAQPREPSRRCECSAIATCVAVVKEGRLTLPLGTRHEYQCPVCTARFAVHDAWGIVFMSFAAAVLAAVGLLVILVPSGPTAEIQASNQGFGVAFLAFSAFAALLFAWRVRQRLTHPLVTP